MIHSMIYIIYHRKNIMSWFHRSDHKIHYVGNEYMKETRTLFFSKRIGGYNNGWRNLSEVSSRSLTLIWLCCTISLKLLFVQISMWMWMWINHVGGGINSIYWCFDSFLNIWSRVVQTKSPKIGDICFANYPAQWGWNYIELMFD